MIKEKHESANVSKSHALTVGRCSDARTLCDITI